MRCTRLLLTPTASQDKPDCPVRLRLTELKVKPSGIEITISLDDFAPERWTDLTLALARASD